MYVISKTRLPLIKYLDIVNWCRIALILNISPNEFFHRFEIIVTLQT